MTTSGSPPRAARRRPLPIAPDVLETLRAGDDAGRPALPFTDEEGGAPLRCCLRPSLRGERIALVAYAPLRRWAARTGAAPGAYDEQGPVFVHASACGGPDPDEVGRHPFAEPGLRRVLRRYDARGHIVGGRLVELPDAPPPVPGDVLDSALEESFTDPRVVLVHVRAVEYGCFLYEVRGS
ncbi:DUF1203 domain-containing protein [Streptomyces sp. TRM 70361]|uniref:DUF1203 domain-containing protein n=1 Tax=Streptomyces sp. TRM 70361 TaxID=3116553 RepID=UPI002E7B0E14|nr:DUF1203 domain-containing protein [Streptomyces sp. TRM 70361]MEE1938098.1 DUF1203 domain-containing protein [Streptomyces sp. TRM 70361]